MESKTTTRICFRFQVNKILTLYQETIKKIKIITVLIKRNSHAKCHVRNIHPIIIIIVFLILHEENNLMDKLQHTQQCKIRTLKLLANVNTVHKNDDNNKLIVSNNVLTTRDNNSWMFDNNSSTSNNSQARICTFNYSSSSSSFSSSTSSSSSPTCEQIPAPYVIALYRSSIYVQFLDHK